jgi:gluconate 2-dehydrogenase gamma chain
MSARSMRRRKFLAGAPAAIAGGSMLACGSKDSGWRFFSADEGRLVTAICDHIIPPDGDPGASWAGVPVFIDRQLMRFHKPHQKAWRNGLAGIEQASRTRFGKPFIELEPEDQLAVLQGAERSPELKPFFDLLVSHAMQGFYGPPRHGGNREAVSWRMLGLPVPPVRGRQI